LNKLPMKLNAKNDWHYAAFDQVYFTSNWPLERQYENLRHDDPKVWDAFRRRITTSQHMTPEHMLIDDSTGEIIDPIYDDSDLPFPEVCRT